MLSSAILIITFLLALSSIFFLINRLYKLVKVKFFKKIPSEKMKEEQFDLETYIKEHTTKMRKHSIRALCAIGVAFIAMMVVAPNQPNNTSHATKKEEAKTETAVAKAPEVELITSETVSTTQNNFKIEGTTSPGVKISIQDDKGKNIYSAISWDGKFSFNHSLKGKEAVYSIVAEKEGMTTNTKVVTVTKKEKPLTEEQRLAKFEKEAKTPKYNALKKSPDSYQLVQAVYKGKVLQALENDGVTDLRISVVNRGYGIWSSSDVIYVTYSGKTPAVEDDIVKVYGFLMGKHEYTSQAGWNISVPLMMADTIKVLK